MGSPGHAAYSPPVSFGHIYPTPAGLAVPGPYGGDVTAYPSQYHNRYLTPDNAAPHFLPGGTTPQYGQIPFTGLPHPATAPQQQPYLLQTDASDFGRGAYLEMRGPSSEGAPNRDPFGQLPPVAMDPYTPSYDIHRHEEQRRQQMLQFQQFQRFELFQQQQYPGPPAALDRVPPEAPGAAPSQGEGFPSPDHRSSPAMGSASLQGSSRPRSSSPLLHGDMTVQTEAALQRELVTREAAVIANYSDIIL